MRIVQVEAGGAIYWIASESGARDEVLRLINADAALDDSLTDDDIDRFEILDAERAESKFVLDDDDRVSLATFARSMTEPGIIACSEWD